MNDLMAGQAIREVVENWAVWRDAGDWERFATVWHPDGWMTATWFQGPAQQFIEASREGFNRGVHILHTLGGWTCEIAGSRAVSQVKMTIHQRAPLDGVLVDVACMGRFYDFFEQRDGRWAIVRRQPIYEKDRLDPVDPSAVLTLDAAVARRATPKATVTWPICKRRTDSRSRPVFPACAGRRWNGFTRRAAPGWKALQGRGCRL